MKLLLSLLFIILNFEAAQAYPHFIGHGYTSCQNCHYNPFGGGMVNDYGRVVNATLISSDAFYPKSWDNEKVAYHSDFLFGKMNKQKYIRAQLNYRGIQIIRNPGSEDSEVSDWITMQKDARLLFKFGENDKLLFSFSGSQTPKTQSSLDGEDQYRSREHYIGFKISPKLGIYAGLMDKPFGIRIVEHTAYSRIFPGVAQNDQSHGLVLHYMPEGWEIGLNYFVGNLEQDAEIRQQGISSTVEKTIAGKHRIGFSVMSGESEVVESTSFAAHSRISFEKGSSLQFEIGQNTKTSKVNDVEITSQYGLLQTYLRPTRGVYFFNNLEYAKANTNEDDYTVRWGPGIQYIPIHRAEFRFELQNIRNFNPKISVKDIWLALLQTHFWL